MKIGETLRLDDAHTLMVTADGMVLKDTSDEAEARMRDLTLAFQMLKEAKHKVAFLKVCKDGHSLLMDVDKLLPVKVTVSCSHAKGLQIETKKTEKLPSSLTIPLLSGMARNAFKTLRTHFQQEDVSLTFSFGQTESEGYVITHIDMDEALAVAA